MLPPNLFAASTGDDYLISRSAEIHRVLTTLFNRLPSRYFLNLLFTTPLHPESKEQLRRPLGFSSRQYQLVLQILHPDSTKPTFQIPRPQAPGQPFSDTRMTTRAPSEIEQKWSRLMVSPNQPTSCIFRGDPSLCCTRVACCLVCVPVFACTFSLADVRAARLWQQNSVVGKTRGVQHAPLFFIGDFTHRSALMIQSVIYCMQRRYTFAAPLPSEVCRIYI